MSSNQNISCANILHNLDSVVDLVLKKCQQNHKSHNDVYYFKKMDVQKKSLNLGKKSSCLINKCLLNHRFSEAAKLLFIMCQDRTCFDLFFYKAMLIVLEHLQPNEMTETMLEFLRNIKQQKFLHKQDVNLEYQIYALKHHLSGFSIDPLKAIRENKRYSLKKMSSDDALLFGYNTMWDYISWFTIRKGGLLASEEEKAAETAIANFKKVLEYPGTWDIFVLKLIEILDCYGRHDEVEDVLKKYVTQNPDHVNAYVYLSMYLYKSKASNKTFIHYSKELVKLCPSDARVLLLVQRWNELGKYYKKRLLILFMFMDYPANGKNILAWKMLSSHISEAFGRKQSSVNAVNSLWEVRRQSWNWMYFTPAQERLELIIIKMNFLSKMDSEHQYIKEALSRNPNLYPSEMGNVASYSAEDFDPLCSLCSLDNEMDVG